MKITFDILDSEAGLIATQYGYDGSTDRDEFVLEQFKQFGRDCIASQASRVASLAAEIQKNSSVEAAKASTSF